MSSASARRRARGHPQLPAVMPSLAARLGLDSGVHRLLETPLVINGAGGASDWAYAPIDATQTTWAARIGGVTLTKQAGAPTIGTTTPYLGSLEGQIVGDGVAYYTPPAAADLDIATEDVWFEALIVTPAADGRLVGKVDVPGARGWQCIRLTESALKFLGYGAGTQIYSPTLTPGDVSFVSFHINRDEASASGARGCANGAAGTGVNYSPNAATWASAQVARVLSNPNYGTPWTGGLLWFRLALRQGWYQAGAAGAAEALEVHRQRFALLTASRPAFSVVPSTYPTAAGSTSPVYQQRRLADGTDRLFYMGAGSPTFDRVVEATARAVVGHLVEAGATNSVLQNCTIATTWTVVNAAVASNSAVAPDGTTTADTLTASGDGGYLRQTFGTITAVQRTYSHWIIRNGGSNVSGKLQIVKTSDSSVIAEVAFTATSAWQRFEIAGTCVLNDTEIRCVLDTNGTSVYLWGAQFSDSDTASSAVTTTTAAVTRAASVCQYSLTNCFPRAEFTLLGALLMRSFTPTRTRVAFSLSDGTTTNEVQLYVDTSGRVNASSRKAGGVSGDCQIAGSIADNAIRRFMLSGRQGQLDLWLRSAAGVWSRSQDLTVDAIAGATLTTLSIGSDGASANQAGPGLYPLVGWQVLPEFISDPSAARSGLDTLWEAL